MSELIWMLDDLNYPDPEQRPEEVPFIESYDLFRNSLKAGSWQIVEIWDGGIVLYADNNRKFWSVPFDFIEELYREPTPPEWRLGGGPSVIFDGFIAGPDLRKAFDAALELFQNRSTRT